MVPAFGVCLRPLWLTGLTDRRAKMCAKRHSRHLVPRPPLYACILITLYSSKLPTRVMHQCTVLVSFVCGPGFRQSLRKGFPLFIFSSFRQYVTTSIFVFLSPRNPPYYASSHEKVKLLVRMTNQKRPAMPNQRETKLALSCLREQQPRIDSDARGSSRFYFSRVSTGVLLSPSPPNTKFAERARQHDAISA